QALKLAATEAERDQLRAHNDELRSELSILTLAHDQLRAQVERLQGGEPVPVEIWRNDRKVTIYPSENVLCVWGKKATEMSEAPFTLASVQSAIDWLYTAQPAAPALVPLTFEQAHNLFLSFMAEPNWTAMDWYFKGLRDSEAHHGIGQPVGGAG
ncbi:MAG: hypothetical protein KGI52_15515, partial [Burkholderiales bacterium]|nr:hypothetical protein [Burkholderiales bacterium]